MKAKRPVGWTTVKEAAKLTKAGISPDTADLHYLGAFMGEERASLYPSAPWRKSHSPCWSIGALLELMKPYQRDTFLKECGITTPIIGQLVEKIISLKKLNLL